MAACFRVLLLSVLVAGQWQDTQVQGGGDRHRRDRGTSTHPGPQGGPLPHERVDLQPYRTPQEDGERPATGAVSMPLEAVFVRSSRASMGHDDASSNHIQ